MKKAILAFISASVLLMASPLAASASSLATPQAAAAPSVANSYSPLAAKWWTWALSQPAASNPLLDTTGSRCSNQQSGPTWFLAGLFSTGGSVTRSCTVPAHKDLFFRLANAFDIEPQSAHKTPAYVRGAGCAGRCPDRGKQSDGNLRRNGRGSGHREVRRIAHL